MWFHASGLILFQDSMKKLQDQKHDMEREIKILHRKLRVSVAFERSSKNQPITDRHTLCIVYSNGK